MEGMLLLCLGLIAYLFYRTNGQKHQLSSLQAQLKKIQSQLVHLQLQFLKPETTTESEPPKNIEAKIPEPAESSALEITASTQESTLPLDPWIESSTTSIKATFPESTSPASKPESKVLHNEPSEFEKTLSILPQLIKSYFSQGNLIVRIGIIVLFFGISFLAKYSIENSLVPIELRMTGILLAALTMLGIGWHLRIKKPAYGLMMQGGGIAISYIAIFASFKLYNLIPSELTFPLLIVFSLLSMTLAMSQNSKALAITAITGGFAAPLLASTGSGSHIGLFSYYLALNCAIFFAAWFKSWRLLNVIGFFFTFIIASVWGATQYSSSHFSTTEPFLVAFFLIYVAISVLFSIKQKPELKGYVDGTLVFGVPMVAFGLQSALVHNIEYGLAYSAAGLAAFYFILSRQLKQQSSTHLHLLSQAMFALGIIFATLTIPFALDGRWSAASWAIEGAGFTWIALRQNRVVLKYLGLALQFLGGLLFLADQPYSIGHIIFLNTEFMGIAIICFSGLFTAYCLFPEDKQPLSIDHSQSELQQVLVRLKHLTDKHSEKALITWSVIWWYSGALIQTNDYISQQYELVVYVALLTFSALLWLFFSTRLKWSKVNFFPWLLLLPLCLYSFLTTLQGHFSSNYGFIIWPLALATLYLILYKSEQSDYALLKPTALHCISFILILCIVINELDWTTSFLNLAGAWQAFVGMVTLVIGLSLINIKPHWPFTLHYKAYQQTSAFVIIAFMLAWSVSQNFLMVLTPDPIPYVPLLNPIDLIQLLSVWTVLKWYNLHGKNVAFNTFKNYDPRWAIGCLSTFIFLWFNAVLLKTIHTVANINYTQSDLFNSAVVQTSVSISWTIIGLALMVLASKKALRQLWLIGAALTAVVVVKLFLLDLSGQDTIERIVSFIVVGALLLIVGYFSPVPPAKNQSDTEAA